MSRDFTDIFKALAHIQSEANKVTKNELARVGINEMQEQIEEVVYSYEPVYPENRRMYNDGLIDPDNMEVTLINDSTISIENIAYDGDRNVPLIVNSGEGYSYDVPQELKEGRKFIEATRDSLRNSNKLENAMVKGLQRRGFDCKNI